MKIFLFTLLFSLPCFSLEVPLVENKWQILKYSKLPPNEIQFNNNQMHIGVDKSASPVIFPLDSKGQFKELQVEGKVQGKLNIKKTPQGSKGNDDFLFRIGLVYEGDQTLNFFQRIAAPSWVKTLFDLNKDGTGIDRIVFYNTYTDQSLKDKNREHPASDLIKENFKIALKEDGTFQFQTKIDSSKNVLAIWISSDGDDTDSKFKVSLEKINLVK
ncbi:MAG: hypothetical protein ACPGJV_00985 [Bacteriovoracaceae bacterium]